MTAHTPYDKRVQALKGDPGARPALKKALAKREGYLRAMADMQSRLDDAASLVDYASSVLDKPEDRLYHAADGTWWSNPNGPAYPTLKSADMPEPLRKRIDALIAAAEEALDELTVLLQGVELRDEKGKRAPDVRDHLRAALAE